MKKLILYSVYLLGAIVGVFTLNTTVVYADGLLNQHDAEVLDLPGSSKAEGRDDFMTSIKTGLGWLITILAIIALFMLVYGGILMVIAAGDEEKHKKGFTIMKQAAVGLIYIGLAWLFIMLIFYIIAIMVGDKTMKTEKVSLIYNQHI